MEVIQLDGITWRLTCFYGHPEKALRHRSWSLLRQLRPISDTLWLVIGDFNEIMRIDEKMGREDRNANQMAALGKL